MTEVDGVYVDDGGDMTVMEAMVVIMIFMITMATDGENGGYDVGDNYSDVGNDNDIMVMMVVTSDD